MLDDFTAKTPYNWTFSFTETYKVFGNLIGLEPKQMFSCIVPHFQKTQRSSKYDQDNDLFRPHCRIAGIPAFVRTIAANVRAPQRAGSD